MNVAAGSMVTKTTKNSWEHGVVTKVGSQTVTVRWHLKQATNLGSAGMDTGTVFELPKELIPDTPCPFCKP